MGQMTRQAATASVCLAVSKAARFNVSAQSTGGFDRLLPTQSTIAVAQNAQKDDPGLATTRNPEDVR
jgi:hypothetical protein